MKWNKWFLLFVIYPFLFSCYNKTNKFTEELKDPINTPLKTSFKQIFDTTILLANIEKSNYKGENLTKILAKKTLYQHFIKQGCFTADNQLQLGVLSDEDAGKLTVEFNDLLFINLNNNLNKDGIITYWLENPFVNGHCVQPKKAIISDTDNGYKITNAEFISESYLIDSLVRKNDQIMVYCYEYDCGNHKVLRQLNINLRISQ